MQEVRLSTTGATCPPVILLARACLLLVLYFPLAAAPCSVATWALVVCAGLVVVSLVGVDVRPLLVLTGGGGVVVGLASQQLLSNAVSGLQMYMDRPFRVGDTIAVTSGRP